jgi:hypothetical protein
MVFTVSALCGLLLGPPPNLAGAGSTTPTGFYYPTGASDPGPYAGWLARPPEYGAGYYHLGKDIRAAEGSQVYAIACGTVACRSTEGWSYIPSDNNVAIVIKHRIAEGSEFVAVYGHVRSGLAVGDRVGAGQIFATLGPYDGAPHLHFGIRLGSAMPDSNWAMMPLSSWPDTKGFVDPIDWITTRVPGCEAPAPPTLSWVGTAGYESDGVEPDSAPAGSTFTFKVKYQGPRAPTTVTVNVVRSFVPVAGSPFAMDNQGSSTDWPTGVVFTEAVSLSQGGDTYFYRFRAYEGTTELTSLPLSPATPKDRPTVTGHTLTWAGTTGYTSDGVQPDTGAAGSVFAFKVKYAHPGGLAPSAVTLSLTRNYGPVPGSPFMMTAGGSNWAAGVVFTRAVPLGEAGGAYYYRFRAYAGATEMASLPQSPAPPQVGPTVTAGATLSWIGATGYTSEGVEPDSGAVGSSFTFRCKYQGPGAPTKVELSVYNGPYPIVGSPFTMTAEVSGNYTNGVVYWKMLQLNQVGTCDYRFRAYSGGWEIASLPLMPAPPQAGPVVTSSGGTLAVSGVTAQQVGGGVSLSYALSTLAAVAVTVLNIAGKPIASLAGGEQGAGVQTLSWNGRNAAGSAVSAGTYLIQVTARTEAGENATSLCTVRLQR